MTDKSETERKVERVLASLIRSRGVTSEFDKVLCRSCVNLIRHGKIMEALRVLDYLPPRRNQRRRRA
jgi:hypothetical protein